MAAQKAQVQWYCGEHTNMDPFRMLFNTAAKEKEDFVYLNDRLGDLFQKLEKLRNEDGTGGSSKYLQTIMCLEEEIKKMRAMYEAELSKLRRDNAMLAGEKAEMDAIAQKLKTANNYLMQKLDDEQKENQRRRDEISELTCKLTHKEHETFELTKYIACLKSSIALMSPKLDKYQRDAEIYAQQYDSEKKLRQDFEDKHQHLVDKLNFDSRQHEQQMRDMTDRLENSHRIISELNEKIRRLMEQASRNNLPALLQKIRDQLQTDFERYRCETEEAVKKTLADMRGRLDERLREKQRLEEERDRLEEMLGKMKGEINQIHSQLAAANQCNQQLQVALQNEKSSAATAIRDLEGKLTDTEECLLQKVREATSARGVQTELRSELESLKSMIESEEDRVSGGCLPPAPCGPPSVIYATQGFPNRSVGCHPSSTGPLHPLSACAKLTSSRPSGSTGQLASGRFPHGSTMVMSNRCD